MAFRDRLKNKLKEERFFQGQKRVLTEQDEEKDEKHKLTDKEAKWLDACLKCPPHPHIGHAPPDHWVETAKKVWEAEKKQKDPDSPLRILFISGSARDEDTCPQEKSKTEQLLERARIRLMEKDPDIDTDWLDLGDMTAAKKPIIHPCKSCFSTAAPHCVWPCNCYPNEDLGQSPDWMGEIYEKWAAAHGVVLATPVKWYMPDGPVVLMIHRLVCADGGNPNPDTIKWKTRDLSRELELSGDYVFTKHLAGRSIGFIVHGDVAGESLVLSALKLTFEWMGFEVAGPHANGEFRIVPEDGSYANNQDAIDHNKNPAMDCISQEIDTVVDSVVMKAKMLRKDYEPPMIPQECMH